MISGMDGREYGDTPQIAVIGALNQSLIVPLLPRNAAIVNLKADATGAMTLTFQVSYDDQTTFITAQARTPVISTSPISALSMTANSQYALVIRAPGATHVRVIATSYTAGNVTAKILPISADLGSWGQQEVIGGVPQASTLVNPVQVSFESRLTQRTATADAVTSRPIVDKLGRVVVVDGQIRELTDNNTINLTNTITETTLIPAVAGVFQDVREIFITNTSMVDVTVDFRDVPAGTIRFSAVVKAGDTRWFAFRRLKQTTVNTSWTAQSNMAVTDLKITAISERVA